MIEYPPKGMKNRDLALLVLSEGYILVTRDHDFANTTLYPPKQFQGTVVLHIHPPKAEKLIERMERLLTKVDSYKGKLLMVKDEVIEVIEDRALAP